MPLASSLMVAAALAASAPTQAERAEASPPEAESGVRLGLGVGAFAFLKAPGTTGRTSIGQTMRLELQVDLFERLSLSVMVWATAHRMGSDYVGLSQGTVAGDFTSLTPAVAARVNLVGIGDTPHDGRRVWLYLRAGGGYTTLFPKKLVDASDVMLFGGLGVEYRTHLRHFSLGLEVLPAYFPGLATVSVAVTPNLQLAL